MRRLTSGTSWIAVAWRREKFTGLLPLAVVAAYLLMHALVRNSGGRYILPVDWASVVYYAMGITHLTLWAAAGLTEKPWIARHKRSVLA
jgi:hypothetical protein